MFAGAAHGPLHQKLSQGDIVDGIPWGPVHSPFTLCRAIDETAAAGKAKYGAPELMKNPDAFAKGRVETVHLRAKRGPGVVVWHSCELDKFEVKGQAPEKWFAAVAPVLPTTALKAEERAALREFDRMALFPLPAAPVSGVPEESYLDLRYIVPVKQALLADRRGTFSPEMLDAFYVHLFKFLTRRMIADAVPCPQCGITIDLDKFAPRSKAAE